MKSFRITHKLHIQSKTDIRWSREREVLGLLETTRNRANGIYFIGNLTVPLVHRKATQAF